MAGMVTRAGAEDKQCGDDRGRKDNLPVLPVIAD